MSRRNYPFGFVRALLGALTCLAMPALALAIVVMETIAFPFICPAAHQYQAHPRSIFQTRRAGLA
jgi:hypothetical protein